MKSQEQLVRGLKGNGAQVVVGQGQWQRLLLYYRGYRLLVIATCGEAWEHVSVSVPGQKRCPTWEEMSFVKDFFWSDAETVMQLHVPHALYINDHPYCLHLWKPLEAVVPVPPAELVGLTHKYDQAAD